MDAKELAQTFNELSSHIASSENGICSVRRELLQRARAALPSDAAQAPTVPAGYAIVPDYRGYAHLGTGQYVLNTSGEKPAELIISIATEAEKAGRAIGELRDNPAGHALQPEDMCVRLRFKNVAGLNALEHKLRELRAEYFAAPVAPAAAAPSDDRVLVRKGRTAKDDVYAAAQPDERAALMDEMVEMLYDLARGYTREKFAFHLRSLFARTTAPQATPIYQIGANAGGGIAWWDVDRDRYEREKKAGYMKTGIVYREPS